MHETGQIPDAKRLADRLAICDAEVWKLLHRRVLMDRNQHAPASAKWQGTPFDGLARGTRAAHDPLYSHLGG